MLEKSVCNYLARAISFFENLGVICSDPVTWDLICLVLIELKYTGKWGNDKRSFFQNPAREILSAPRAFLALMFLNKRVTCYVAEKKRRGGKNARSSPRQCIPATMPAYLQKEDSTWDKPCDLFLEALCAQTNLFWREMKNMYTEI